MKANQKILHCSQTFLMMIFSFFLSSNLIVAQEPNTNQAFTSKNQKLIITHEDYSDELSTAGTSGASSAVNITINGMAGGYPGVWLRVDGVGYGDSPVTFAWTTGSQHTIVATNPICNSLFIDWKRWVFEHWSDGGPQHYLYSTPATNDTLVAVYQSIFRVVVSASSGGYVVVTPAAQSNGGGRPPTDGWYNSGTDVRLEAVPDIGYAFQEWRQYPIRYGEPTPGGTENPKYLKYAANMRAIFKLDSSTITVTSPNGGEEWVAGSDHYINWQSEGTSGYVRIEYSTNGGSDWTEIVASAFDDGTYNIWTIPHTPSDDCYVRVTDTDGFPGDMSDNSFSIIEPYIRVNTPNGGETWNAGSVHDIIWYSEGTSGNVKIEYSANGGTSWSTIVASTPDDNNYAWTIPNTPSTSCLVRVSDVSGPLSDQSDSYFTITGTEYIIITSPNGGEILHPGNTHNITWNSSGTSGNVKIEYSTDGGSNWTTLTTSTADNGSYPWLIPNTPSINCFVRVSDTDGNPTDQNNSPFEIRRKMRHFTPAWTGHPFQPMTVYCIKAELYGQPLIAGDEIGIFDGNKCVGTLVLTQSPGQSNVVEIICSKDDGAGNGFSDGHPMIFKVWDQSAGSEFGARPQFLDVQTGAPIPPLPFQGLGTALVELTVSGVINQSIDLKQGWNIFSLPVTPEGSHNMLNLLSPILNQLVKVIDERGHSILKLFGNWNNSIGNWGETEGYYINVSQNVTLTVRGTEIATPLSIPLNAGWNIISYPCFSVVQNALSVVQPVINNGYLVKVIDEQGHSIVKIFGIWNNSIGDMKPGEGYYVNVNSGCTLTVTSTKVMVAANAPYQFEPIEPKHFTLETTGHPFEPMNIFIVEAYINGEQLIAGDEIAVYDGNRCVGISVLSNPLSTKHPLEIVANKDDDGSGNGFEDGNQIGFRVWKRNADEEFLIDAAGVQYFDSDRPELTAATSFKGLGTAVVAINLTTTTVTENNMVPMNYRLYQNFPNPFNSATTIRYALSNATDVEIVIYDLQGNVVRGLFKGYQDVGHHAIEWDGRNSQGNSLVSGIYFYQLTTNQISATKKMILTK